MCRMAAGGTGPKVNPPRATPHIICAFVRASPEWVERCSTCRRTMPLFCTTFCANCGGRDKEPQERAQMNRQKLDDLTAKYRELRIGVLGEFCLDRYLEIDP